MVTKNLDRVNSLLQNITAEIFGTVYTIKAYYDKENEKVLQENGIEPRVYLQAHYESSCTDTGEVKLWNTGKHYLSSYMTDDEIIKRAWVCFEMGVKHEVMEGFKVNGIRLFNPHVDYTELLKISDKEVKRN